MLRILTFVIIAALIAFGCTYFYIDSQIQARIIDRSIPTTSGIYSRPFEIYSGRIFDVQLLNIALHERHYLRIDRRPSKPGEYIEQHGLFEIYLRETYHPIFGKQPAGLVIYNSNKGMIDSELESLRERFILEPILLSPLGTKSIKVASSQPLKSFPDHLAKLLMSAEDQRFYQHFGIDLIGIARAIVVNIKSGRLVQGGSTLTQQLAKNLLLTPRRTLGRKLMEAVAALSLEWHFTKDEILELYLNEVYLGQEGAVAIHGFAEAAKTFYRKKVEDLSVAEAALLVGIIRAPSYYSPRNNMKRAITRRNTVLKQAHELKYLSNTQLQQALKDPTKVNLLPRYRRSAPFFETALIKELSTSINEQGLLYAGAKIYTGIDPTMQRCGQKAIDDFLPQLFKERPTLAKLGSGGLEVGIVAVEPRSGLIRTYVGGKNYATNQFDHVQQAQRQIGSTVKPFIYVAAMDPTGHNYKVATTVSIIKDAPFEIAQPRQPVWRPDNYDKKFRGDVTLRYALEHSLNVPAAYVASRIGFDTLATTLERFKLGNKILPVPALSLGAIDVNLLQLTAAYAALANGGIYTQPRLYFAVIDKDDQRIAASTISEHRVANEDAAYLVTNMLQGVIERGTGSVIRKLGYTEVAAGKTGTSNDQRDSWFIGYTPEMAVGVWLGNDANLPIGLTGGNGAARLWAHFMKCSAGTSNIKSFLPGPNIVNLVIDRYSGKQISPGCSGAAINELFIRGTEPEAICPGNEPQPMFDSTTQNWPKRPIPPQQRQRKSFWERLLGE